MKRIIIFCAVAVAAVGLVLSHSDLASAKDMGGKGADKIKVCHNGKLQSSKKGLSKICARKRCPKGQRAVLYRDTYKGHIIEVSVNAAKAHKDHGDPAKWKALKGGDDCFYTVDRCECEDIKKKAMASAASAK